MISISNDWNYYPEEDIYRHKYTSFSVSGLYIKDYTKNWGRPFERTHLIAILNKCFDEYREWHDRQKRMNYEKETEKNLDLNAQY